MGPAASPAIVRRVRTAALLALVLAAAACKPSFKVSSTVNRSGTVQDDYVEEPISARSKQYAPALDTSNALIERLKAGEQRAVYQEDLSEELRGSCSEAQWIELWSKAELHAGKIVGYKPMQWSFTSSREQGRALLASSKVVECERGMIDVIFTFPDDGAYEQPLGVRWRTRSQPAPKAPPKPPPAPAPPR